MNEGKQSKLLKLTEETIERTIKDGLTTNNLDIVLKLSKIKHYEKEDENMYGNYSGRGPSRGAYGRDNYNEGNYGEYNERYNDYGRRGVDSKYRGYGHLDRMYNEYGNYSYGRERYGTNEDTKKSLEYMLRSMEDFARMLKEEAQSQEEVQMIKQTAQRIAQM